MAHISCRGGEGLCAHRMSSSGSCGQERCVLLPLNMEDGERVVVVVVVNDELIAVVGAAVVSALIFG